MAEHWENVISEEFRLLRGFPEFQRNINDLLLENELNIQWPITQYEHGEVYYCCPGTEAQALDRIEREALLRKTLAVRTKKINRLLAAMDKLEPIQAAVVRYMELDHTSLNAEQLALDCDIHNLVQLCKVWDEGIHSLYKIYQQERIAAESEERLRRAEARRQMAASLKEQSTYKGAAG
ncbi:hypothetical protein [Bacillus testis]|uniref:hypothetical protein n=1 Tax=Bacillus testis TaxID=1622072 RepID=UPI00067F2D83|nr:hypothetical protein [Bacillus testis]